RVRVNLSVIDLLRSLARLSMLHPRTSIDGQREARNENKDQHKRRSRLNLLFGESVCKTDQCPDQSRLGDQDGPSESPVTHRRITHSEGALDSRNHQHDHCGNNDTSEEVSHGVFSLAIDNWLLTSTTLPPLPDTGKR